MKTEEKRKLLIAIGCHAEMTDEIVEDAWSRLQKFFKVMDTIEVLDKQGLVVDTELKINPKTTEEKVIEGVKRWAILEKQKKEESR